MQPGLSDRKKKKKKKKAKKLATVIQNRKQHALRAIYKIEN